MLHAAWWDEDEDATFEGKLSFLQEHRVAYYRAKASEAGNLTTDEEVHENALNMCRALQVALISWRLRERTPSYEEAQANGVGRKIVGTSVEDLIAQPLDDIAFMYAQVFPRPVPPPVPPVKTPEEQEDEEEAEARGLTEGEKAEMRQTVLMPEAKEAGLTRAGFSDKHADPVHLPGRRGTGVLQRRGST